MPLGKACMQSLERIVSRKTDCALKQNIIPLSDGGEGFLRALRIPLDLTIKKMTVTGPLGTPISAEYGISSNSSIAVCNFVRYVLSYTF